MTALPRLLPALLLLFLGGCTINLAPAPGSAPAVQQPQVYQPVAPQPVAAVPQQPAQGWPVPTQPVGSQPVAPQPAPVQAGKVQALLPGWQNPLPPQPLRRRSAGACRPAGQGAIGRAPLAFDQPALAAVEERAIAVAGFTSAGTAKSVERPGSWGAPLGLFGLITEVSSELCLEAGGERVTGGTGVLSTTVVWRIYRRPGPIPLVERRLTGRARIEGRSRPAAFDRLLRSAVEESLRAFLADPEVRQAIATGRRPDGFSIPPGGPIGDPTPVTSSPPIVAPQPVPPTPPAPPAQTPPSSADPGLALSPLPPFQGSAADHGPDIARAIVTVEGAGGQGLGVLLDQKQGLVLTATALLGGGAEARVTPALGTVLTGKVARGGARGVVLLSLGRNGPWRALPRAPEAPRAGATLLQFLEAGRGKQPARFAGRKVARRLSDGRLELASAANLPAGTALLDPAGNLAGLVLGSQGARARALEIDAALSALSLR